MSNVIEVLLKKDIKTLGNRGEVVKVSKGYARNYLFPQKLALLPTKEGLLELEREKKEEMIDLQQHEADKPPPLAVQRAQTHTEANPGIAG